MVITAISGKIENMNLESKGKILVVDDIRPNLELQQDILSREGYTVIVADNGEDALAAVERESPDLILLDIEMPGMKGYEVCSRLKANEKTSGIPVIFLSALDEVFDKVKAFEVGGVDYVTKPFQVEEVLVRLETHMAIRSLQLELEGKNAMLNKEISQRKVVEKQLKQLAISDFLTGAYNRRFFFEMADREISRSTRDFRPLALVMFDIDHFKNVNDSYGHLVGDQVLVNLTKFFKQSLRATDVFARYGGEEFVILMPDTDCNAAFATGERFREQIEGIILAKGEADVKVTISLGVACAGSIDELDIMRLLALADKALYQSKETGRNKSIIWGWS